MTKKPLMFLLVALVASGCAHSGPRFERAASLEAAALDPWETTNRKLYAMNRRADHLLMQPVASVYRTAVPLPARRGVANAYSNFGEPLNFANALLQGKVKRAFRALDRVLINSVLGIGGIADHATDMQLPELRNDFGQTMAVWGVGSGPYLIMPFFGPSTARDGTGFLVDFFADPTDFGARRLLSGTERIGKIAVRVVDARAQLAESGEQLLTGAADEYATVRSAWLQIRRRQLFDDNPPPVDDPLDDPDEVIAPYPDAPNAQEEKP